jgi:hypothetical protein
MTDKINTGIYQWNDDLNIVTQQTEESKRAGEILENLKLGCVFLISVAR